MKQNNYFKKNLSYYILYKHVATALMCTYNSLKTAHNNAVLTIFCLQYLPA